MSATLVAAAAVASFGAAQVVAHGNTRTACKPGILTQAEVAKALRLPVAEVEMSPASSEGVPQVGGQPVYAGKDRQCDWGLTVNGHIGLGDGRASLYVFGSADDASAWFAAYTAAETRPACKAVSFPLATAACNQVGPFPGGVYPLFQAVQGRYVVWIHLIQKKLNLSTLQALAASVFRHAPQA